MTDLHLGVLAVLTFLAAMISMGMLLTGNDTVASALGAVAITGCVIFIVRDRHND